MSMPSLSFSLSTLSGIGGGASGVTLENIEEDMNLGWLSKNMNEQESSVPKGLRICFWREIKKSLTLYYLFLVEYTSN